MVKLYEDFDLWEATIQRRKILCVFLAVTAAFLGGLIGLVVYYISLPYKDSNQTWVTAVTCVLTALYLCFCFPFMGIKFKRCNCYCKMLRFISVGLKEYSVMPFAEIDDWVTRDGVDVNVAVFFVKNIKKDEDMRRQIFVDGEKAFPPFKEGEQVRVISQGNLLIEYELLENGEPEKDTPNQEIQPE